MPYLIECPKCHEATDFTAAEPQSTVACQCGARLFQCGLMPVPDTAVPAISASVEWMLEYPIPYTELVELPKRACPWCCKNVGVRTVCPSCSCDLSATGKLLLQDHAADLDPTTWGLYQRHAQGPFATEALLLALHRLTKDEVRTISGKYGKYTPLPDSIARPPGYHVEIEGRGLIATILGLFRR